MMVECGSVIWVGEREERESIVGRDSGFSHKVR